MKHLRLYPLVLGIATGLALLIALAGAIPDRNLHIIICNVGQGDAAYIRLPGGRDILIDTGPDAGKTLPCLGRHMPLWDRRISMIFITHPEADHIGGLAEILRRFRVDYLVRSDVGGLGAAYEAAEAAIRAGGVQTRFVTAGEEIRIGDAFLSVLWPTEVQLAKARLGGFSALPDPNAAVLGASTASEHLNDFSVIVYLRYGNFDALFPGDADTRVESAYRGMLEASLSQPEFDPVHRQELAHRIVEVLKVPHHGSKTGMSRSFVETVRPVLSVISVGRNTFGHPTPETLAQLAHIGSRVLRTDTEGDIEIVSDGRTWRVKEK
ncbi:MBL fold metallo-hydrolase [Patescibacteria group bacterium]|nr:MBL fold metallo-hydrolase [Patescibacteria group bacterium]